MKCKRGDVVLVDCPFASGGGSKVRPALVVQTDRNNLRLDNTLIVQVTSRVAPKREPTHLFIEVASSAGKQSGLLRDSTVSCENVFTVRQDNIVRVIGSLPAEQMLAIDACLKEAFGIRS